MPRPSPLLLLIALSAWACAPGDPSPLAAQDTLRFEPTVGHPTFDVREPVATIRPGQVLVSRTMHGGYYEPGGGALLRASASGRLRLVVQIPVASNPPEG